MENQKNKIALRRKIPSIPELEKHFLFIEDSTLRQNIAISFQYIIFLITLLDELDAENTTISSSIHKDMIVHTGTIIECCLHYCLKRYIDGGVVKSSDVMPVEWETRNPKSLYKISDDEEVCGAIKFKKTEHLTDQTNFIVLNRAAQKAEILTDILFKQAEKIRTLRNKIHLASLGFIDDTYKKQDSQEVFVLASNILEIVERKLNELETKQN